MMSDNSEALNWHRARMCANGACMEVAHQDDSYLLRDSKQPDIAITLTGAEWRAFVAGIRDGDFDFN